MATGSLSVDRATLTMAIFQQLQGVWSLIRQLSSSNATEPSGECEGTATFTARKATLVDGHQDVDEMLYHEAGEFELSANPVFGMKAPKFPFSRKYIWRKSVAPNISVWFTKPGTEELDYMFHRVNITERGDSTPSGRANDQNIIVLGMGDHLCVEDRYNSEYEFHVQVGQGKIDGGQDGPRLMSWKTRHTVVGPKKNQLIETNFTRLQMMPPA